MAASPQLKHSLQPDLLVQLYAKHNLQRGDAAPEWLKNKRQIAFDFFFERGLPTTRSEAWRYTNLKRLAKVQFSLSGPEDLEAKILRQIQSVRRKDCTNLVLFNGWFQPKHSDSFDTFTGVEFTRLSDAFTSPSHHLIPYLSGEEFSEELSLNALNFALMQDGIHLRMRRQQSLRKPVMIHSFYESEEIPMISCPRIIVEVEPNSEIEIIERHYGDCTKLHWANPMTELRVDDGAFVNYHRFAVLSGEAFHTGITEATVRKSSTLRSFSFSRGSALMRHDLQVLLAESGAHANLWGLYLNDVGEHSDHHSYIRHMVADTSSDQLYRGIMRKDSKATFNGKIVVQPQAQRTAALQANHNLLLSEEAEINTKPELEIEADDVKCSHGATVGQLSEDELYYLQSRGIDRGRAQALLSRGFASAVSNKIKCATTQQLIQTELDGFFSGAE